MTQVTQQASLLDQIHCGYEDAPILINGQAAWTNGVQADNSGESLVGSQAEDTPARYVAEEQIATWLERRSLEHRRLARDLEPGLGKCTDIVRVVSASIRIGDATFRYSITRTGPNADI